MKKRIRKQLVALVSAGAVLFSSIPAMAAGESNTAMMLWYDEPATSLNSYDTWQQATLPIGNGILGANIYGELSKEHLTINEETLWSGGRGSVNGYNGGNPSSSKVSTYEGYAATLLNGGGVSNIENLAGVNANNSGYYEGYQPLGDLYFDFGHSSGNDYERVLDLENGISTVEYTNSSVDYTREYFASNPDNVIVSHFEAGTSGELDFTVSFTSKQNVTNSAAETVAESEAVAESETAAKSETAAYMLSADTVSGNSLSCNTLTTAESEAAAYMLSADTVSANGLSRNTQITAESENVGYMTIAGTVANNGLLHNTQIAVISDGMVSANGANVTVSGATTATVYLTAATDYKNTYWDEAGEIAYYYRTGETAAELNARVKGDLDSVVEKGYNAVKNAHTEDYQDLYKRVELDLGQSNELTTDALLQAYKNGTATAAQQRYLEVLVYQYGRYLLIAGSRENSQLPTNLQGIWNNNTAAPWYSDIHTNINEQMNYWLSNNCNLTECALPLVEYMKDLEIPGGRTVEIYTGSQHGIMAHTQNTPYGYTSPGWSISTWGWSPAAATWLLQNCYDYYEYSGDTDTLRNSIYPMLKEQVLMYEDLLEEYNGRLVMPITQSPELATITAGNTYEQSLIWQLYADTIEAAKLLGADGDLISGWQTTMDALKPIEIGTSGQVKEWYTETSINSVNDTRSHRHLSNLLGLYPGNLFDTEEEINAAIVSLNNKNFGRVGTSNNPEGGWTYGQLINSWARVGNGENAYFSVKTMIQNRLYANLWDWHTYNSNGAFQIDGNYGYSAGIGEMLLQSNLGYMNLLPAIPSEWSDGSVEGLLAEGGFEVDMSWSNKNLTNVSITAKNGGKCSVKNWTEEAMVVTDQNENKVETTYKDGICTFNTSAGSTYTVKSQAAPELNVSYERNADGTVTLTWNGQDGVTYTIKRRTVK